MSLRYVDLIAYKAAHPDEESLPDAEMEAQLRAFLDDFRGRIKKIQAGDRMERLACDVRAGIAEMKRMEDTRDARHSATYTAYIQSAAWCEKRTEALRRAGFRCQRCRRVMGRGRAWLQVHHKTYERLGHESPADLEVLCIDCHEQADEQRKAKTMARRLNAWAVRKYGEHWQDVYEPDDIEDEFYDWLERQGDGL